MSEDDELTAEAAFERVADGLDYEVAVVYSDDSDDESGTLIRHPPSSDPIKKEPNESVSELISSLRNDENYAEFPLDDLSTKILVRDV